MLYALVPGFEKIHALQQDLVTGRGDEEDGSDKEDADGSEEEEGFEEEDLGLVTPSSSEEEVKGDDELWEDASGSGSGEDLGEMGGELDALDAEEECREEEKEEAEREKRRSAKKERREAKRAKKQAKRGERRSEDARAGTDAPGTSPSLTGTPGKKSVHFRLKKNMVREFLKSEKLSCSPSKATPRKSALREGQAPSPLFPRFLKKQKREAKEAAAWGEAPQVEPPRVGGAPSSRGRRGGSPRERGRSPHGRGRSFRGRRGSPRGRGRYPQGVRQNRSFRG